MNIWDSVQRGLEKATQEATRIAKAQRLRATLESLTKQIEVQQGAITSKAMELFKNGQLTQNELFILCQELDNTQQQFVQAQSELKQIQQSQNNPGATTTSTQQTFQPYDNSQPSLIPPPPPGVELLTGSSNETIRSEIPPPPPGVSAMKHCSNCFAVLIPGNAFCHNCGSPVRTDINYQATVRSNSEDAINLIYSEQTVLNSEEQPTVRATDEEHTSEEKDGGL